jgi:hypothetical protein
MRTLQTSSPAALPLGRSTMAATAPLLAASASGRVNSKHFSQQQRVDRPRENTVRPFMNIFRTFALLLATAGLLGLGGCASTVSKERVLQLYPVGESTLFGVVPGKPNKDLANLKCAPNSANSDEGNKYQADYICPNLGKLQIVSVVFHTKVWGTEGLKYMPAYAPIDMNIEEDDILETSLSVLPNGQLARPLIVKRIARKAKDATKESGCWWDGGKGATTAFIGGGAVCDGWNWRTQKFANE